MVENNHVRETKAPKVKKNKTSTMVPLFSQRSIMAMAIGALIGIALGFGLSIVSPMLTNGKTWKSEVNVQLVNPGSSYLALRDLQNIGMNYTAKAGSYAFLEFLSQELTELAPQYSHDSSELYKMISITYDSLSATPAFLITVDTPIEKETSYLISQIPEIFKKYLILEENNERQQLHQSIEKAISNVKNAILETEEEMSTLAPEGAAGDIQNNPDYIALNAKIIALENTIDSQASEISMLVASGNVTVYNSLWQQEYETTLQQVKTINTELIRAQQALQALEPQDSNIDTNPDSVILNAKINALQAQIDRLMTGYTEVDNEGETLYITGLAEMISNGVVSGTNYQSIINKIEKASAALVEAREQLKELDTSTSSSNSVDNLEYELARVDVENLNLELSALREKLILLASEAPVAEGYITTQTAFERSCTALAEARTELAILQAQAGDTLMAQSLEYQTSQNKLQDLNIQLNSLNEKLNASLASYTDPAQAANYLQVDIPTIPEPMVPIKLRDALILGAVVGIGGAWVILNYRWLTKGTPEIIDDGESEDKTTI